MNTNPSHSHSRALFACALLFLLTLTAGAADRNPPERMTYQGFLTDGNGAPLGAAAPKNYDVIFRIWKDSSSSVVANRLWSEQQTVTVDKGFFSVFLGEGADVGSEPRPNLSTVFTGPAASDRFVGITVKGIGSGGADADILPRLRMLSSPYAFIARNATALVSQNGDSLVTTANGALTVNGTLAADSITGSGAGLSGLTAGQIPSLDASKISSGVLADARIPNLDASKISSGVLADARIPNLDASKISSGVLVDARIPNLAGTKITSGTVGDARLSSNVALRNSPNTFTQNQIFNGDITANGKKVAVGEETLRIVRGNVSASGVIEQGTGFTVVRNSNGDYSVSFNTVFSDVPTVTCTASSVAQATTIGVVRPILPGGVRILTIETTPDRNYLFDAPFSFIAIGPR